MRPSLLARGSRHRHRTGTSGCGEAVTGAPAGGASPEHDGGIYDSRVIAICETTGQDLTAVLHYGGVCGGALSFSAYIVPMPAEAAQTPEQSAILRLLRLQERGDQRQVADRIMPR